MKTFDSLTEQEVLALAIALEEEDARIYEDFADGLQENNPEQAAKFRIMRGEEDSHRHRLLEHYKSRFGDHVPLIRRQDVRGFVDRKPVWLIRPLGLKTVQKTAESMEVETRRFYEAAAHRATDTGTITTYVMSHFRIAAELFIGRSNINVENRHATPFTLP